ncbi:Vitamin B12 import ATP-binding protein BtuD [Streptomyces antimycoticus]
MSAITVVSSPRPTGGRCPQAARRFLNGSRRSSWTKSPTGIPTVTPRPWRGVSLTLPMGSVTAVVGENGSGKSTLMKILSGMLLPHTGTLHWGEADLTDLDRAQVFERVSLLTQDFQRWPLTAAMNIRLGRPAHPAADQDLEPSVDYAVAGPVIAKLPDGLSSLLAQHVPRRHRTVRRRMAESGSGPHALA